MVFATMFVALRFHNAAAEMEEQSSVTPWTDCLGVRLDQQELADYEQAMGWEASVQRSLSQAWMRVFTNALMDDADLGGRRLARVMLRRPARALRMGVDESLDGASNNDAESDAIRQEITMCVRNGVPGWARNRAWRVFGSWHRRALKKRCCPKCALSRRFRHSSEERRARKTDHT